MSMPITPDRLAAQESVFAEAFAARDIALARRLYHPEVVYLSPTVRVYDWPPRIEGIDKTLEFIQLTIAAVRDIRYEMAEWAIPPDAASAFVRIHFDWTRSSQRLRSNYVVLYRYRDGLIGQQEVYYDPSGRLEILAAP